MYREQIDAYIDSKKDEMLKDLSELVAIDSTRQEPQEGKPYGEGAAAALDAMGRMMERCGLSVKEYAHHAVAGDFGEGEKELDILAHLDVVPVTKDWTVTQPFEAKVVGDRIYGRGTSDDKGPAIAALYAIRAMRDLNIPLKRSVRLICGSDEECGSSDLQYYYGIEKEAPCTFTPDADYPLINLEKGRLAKAFTCEVPDAGNGQKKGGAVLAFSAGDKVNVVPGKAEMAVAGIGREELLPLLENAQEITKAEFTLEPCEVNTSGCAGGKCENPAFRILVKGMSAHGALPYHGNNALTALLELVRVMRAEGFLADDPVAEKLVGAATVFPHGDTAGKGAGIEMKDEVSGALTQNLGILKYEKEKGILYGEFDIRAPLCANDDNLTAVMKDALAGAGFAMEEGPMRKPHYVPADSPFVKTLLESYERYFGKKGTPLYTGGGTYVHDLERGVAFGCMVEGVDNHMHGDDEFMEIPMLLMSAKIFADVIVKLCV